MNNILVLCQTPYQIIVASKIVEAFYSDEEVDIVITNNINGGNELVERLNNSNLFRNAFYLKTKKISFIKKFDPLINYINKLREVDNNLKPFLKKYKYSKFLFCNIDILVQHISKHLNKYISFDMIMFEDGLSSYRKCFGDFFENYHGKCNLRNKIRYSFLRSQFSNIKGFYLFNPKYLEWSPQFPIYKIPPIQKKDVELIKELNEIFMYDNLKKEYKFKYIFFEESYFADGYKVNDVDLVNKISNIVGRKNIFIKIHPRSPVNRFKELGYFTNEITSIPWEIIALNMQLEDKVLITIASGSVIHPTIIMGVKIKAIMLFKLKELETQLLEGLINIIENICKKNPQNYLIPIDYSELKTYLEKTM